jgi:uncharacterized protein YbjT (DUF2867 family)
VARSVGSLEALVDISQMTVSQMRPDSTSESHQQRLHWLSEQVLDWSGLPVVHIRPTVFLAVLQAPEPHVGQVYELTGRRSQDTDGSPRSTPAGWAGR